VLLQAAGGRIELKQTASATNLVRHQSPAVRQQNATYSKDCDHLDGGDSADTKVETPPTFKRLTRAAYY
jgi:hypothetical protein